ncbi:MAG: hypothetical protein KDC03_16450 [Flavobacteriales bacterium]|nr:hypothetical protein [Flavobacteriales bacterium]
MTSRPGSGLRPWQTVLIIILLIVGIVVLVWRGGSDSRAPAPTPVNEDVHDIAP